jgi:hypothetical protein
MSYLPCENSAQDPETPNPVTPTKPPRNAGASQDNPDADNSECQYDSYEPRRKQKKRRVETKKRDRHLIVYVPIKRWPTGDRAEIKEDEMTFDIAEEAHKEMLLSGFNKAIHIPSPPILDYGRRGRYTSRAALLIRFIMSDEQACRMQVHAQTWYGQSLSRASAQRTLPSCGQPCTR